ncbi:MAG: M56 family metallopeptidase [Chitinophagaceae bacterium]
MIPYIINVSLMLTACLAFYKLLLQKETFYRLNRYILLVCLLVSFSLPLVRVPQQWSLRKAEEKSIVINPIVDDKQQQQANTVSSKPVTVAPATDQTGSAAVSSSFSLKQGMTWLVYLYWFGVIVFALNFLAQLIVLMYRAYTKPVIKDGNYRIVEVSGDKAPCSFVNNIFINPAKYEWDTYNQILLHEKVHIRQKHSLDILLAEIVLIFQWFNPFAWLYRKEVESNLEFLTDDHLVQRKEVEPADYQLSLLKVSTPHFPLSLTTNYNQSLLKKRIVMMNAKKSNVHTAWKYFFLLPLLVLFACLLNEPVAYGQSNTDKNKEVNKDVKKDNDDDDDDRNHKGIETEGVWFATIKNDKIQFNFKRDNDEDRNSYNGSSFALSDFPNLPKGQSGTFSLTREAGTMEFTGKFEGNEGMGRYKFNPNRQYGDYMSSEGVGKMSDQDLMVFFFIDIKKSYVKMLQDEGYAKIRKNDLIPLAALNVDKNFIRSVKDNGFKNVDLNDLIPMKSLGVDGNYIREIRDAGYKDIDVQQLISFKAQGIDKEYLAKMRKSTAKTNRSSDNNNSNESNNSNNTSEDRNMSANEIVSMKALKIDEEYINSFKEVGFTNLAPSKLVPMKSLGITPEYIKGFQAMGYKDIDPDDVIPLKAQNITPEYIKEFEALGFKEIGLNQIISVKAMGITPAYISSMKQKGFNYTNLNKYVQLKSITE